MQDLIVGEFYEGTLIFGPWSGEKVKCKFLKKGEYRDTVHIEMLEHKIWSQISSELDDWEAGEELTLERDYYTFEPLYIQLEND